MLKSLYSSFLGHWESFQRFEGRQTLKVGTSGSKVGQILGIWCSYADSTIVLLHACRPLVSMHLVSCYTFGLFVVPSIQENLITVHVFLPFFHCKRKLLL